MLTLPRRPAVPMSRGFGHHCALQSNVLGPRGDSAATCGGTTVAAYRTKQPRVGEWGARHNVPPMRCVQAVQGAPLQLVWTMCPHDGPPLPVRRAPPRLILSHWLSTF